MYCKQSGQDTFCPCGRWKSLPSTASSGIQTNPAHDPQAPYTHTTRPPRQPQHHQQQQHISSSARFAAQEELSRQEVAGSAYQVVILQPTPSNASAAQCTSSRQRFIILSGVFVTRAQPTQETLPFLNGHPSLLGPRGSPCCITQQNKTNRRTGTACSATRRLFI